MSARNDIQKALYTAIAKNMNIPMDQLNDKVELIHDLGAKSVDFVRILCDIEDEFDFTIPFMEFRRKKTLGEGVDFAVSIYES